MRGQHRECAPRDHPAGVRKSRNWPRIRAFSASSRFSLLNRSTAVRMASRLVRARVCRRASSRTLSGISIVVFTLPVYEDRDSRQCGRSGSGKRPFSCRRAICRSFGLDPVARPDRWPNKRKRDTPPGRELHLPWTVKTKSSPGGDGMRRTFLSFSVSVLRVYPVRGSKRLMETKT